ncbi:hypothetical protein BSL78_20322 [Apostichopus japonicus]|uniref:Uncharacterized protein n=1 Tax=Stichopus japonicus TaxID=307972 RepID=A0A2G8K4F7_STIJA|nr:hypothetical protein BSL78_20322 [Apostichopus japonicus]
MVISKNQQLFTDHVVQFKAVSTYQFDNSNVAVSTEMPPRLKYSTESIPLLSHGSDLPTNHSDAMTAKLQLKSLREAYASVHTGINEIKVLMQDPNGEIHSANDEDANMFRRQLLKSMNVDSSIIDDYIDSRDVELQPDLAEWEHLPGQLKKYAPFVSIADGGVGWVKME